MMRLRIRLACIAVTPLALGAAPEPVEYVVSGDGIVAVTVDGVPGHLRIDPGAPGVPLLTADFAARAKLRGGSFGFGFGVGPQTIHHSTGIARLDIGQGPFKRRFGWGERAYAAVADGTIGPAALPEPVIRFVLREPRPGERTVALPMDDGGSVFGLFSGFGGLYAQITVAGEPMRVRFDPHHARTLANAGAALRLAAAQDGRLFGGTVPTEIEFGIERPVRGMTMARPLSIGPLSIATLGVRTSDGGNATRIADGSAPERVDPEEIVVTAKGKKRNPNRDVLSIGADQLERCSSLVFDKPAKVIRLSCV